MTILTDYQKNQVPYLNISLGKNTLENRDYEVKEIQTALHGTCVVIIPKFNITYVPFGWEVILRPSPDIRPKDMISKYNIYLTSNESWHNLVWAEWPQYSPSVIKVDRNSRYYYPAKVTEYLYTHGTYLVAFQI